MHDRANFQIQFGWQTYKVMLLGESVMLNNQHVEKTPELISSDRVVKEIIYQTRDRVGYFKFQLFIKTREIRISLVQITDRRLGHPIIYRNINTSLIRPIKTSGLLEVTTQWKISAWAETLWADIKINKSMS